MDLTLYILIALLACSVYKCAVWRDRFITSDRYVGVLKHIIAQKDVDLAVKDELIEILEWRRDMAVVGDVKTFKIINEKYWLN